MSTDQPQSMDLSAESTKINVQPLARPQSHEGRTHTPSEIRKPAQAADPRKASDVQKPAAAPAAGEEEDPEKLLREYADRQKTRMQRMEQQLSEYKKVVAERDTLKSKAEAYARELQEARKQLEGSARQVEVVKDLQGKIDAAILSNSFLTEEKEKFKKALAQQGEQLKKAEERAAQAERTLADVQKHLSQQAEARMMAESRIAAAVQALQSDSPKPATGLHTVAARPSSTPVEPIVAKSEPAPAPATARPAHPVRPPLRFVRR